MKRFKNWLTEAFSAASADKVDSLIKKYLEKKIGSKFTKMPGVEDFVNDIESGYGIRYFYGTKSVRFNWSSSISAMSLHSVDLWDGSKSTPAYHIEFERDVSIVKMLPTIVDIMLNPQMVSFDAIPQDDLKEELNLLAEATTKFDIWNSIVEILRTGKPVKYWDVVRLLGVRSKPILSQLRELFPDSFINDGRTVLFSGKIDMAAVISKRNEIMGDVGAVPVKITSGFSKEEIKIDPKIQAMEDQGFERLAYEDQLKDLATLLKLLLKNASNSLWVAGRGGCLDKNTEIKIYKENLL